MVRCGRCDKLLEVQLQQRATEPAAATGHWTNEQGEGATNEGRREGANATSLTSLLTAPIEQHTTHFNTGLDTGRHGTSGGGLGGGFAIRDPTAVGVHLPPPAGERRLMATAEAALGGSGGSDLFFGDTTLADLLGGDLQGAQEGGAPRRESSSAIAAAANAGPPSWGGGMAGTTASGSREQTVGSLPAESESSLGEVHHSTTRLEFGS